jgi:hypothetical protein
VAEQKAPIPTHGLVHTPLVQLRPLQHAVVPHPAPSPAHGGAQYPFWHVKPTQHGVVVSQPLYIAPQVPGARHVWA